MKEKRTHRGAFGGESLFTDSQHDSTKEKLNEIFEGLKKKVPTLEKEFDSDCYFVFEEHILYFHDTRIPEWDLALWAHYDDDMNMTECSFIGEHKYLVDKFKPSRTWISTKDENEFIESLNLIHEKPYECYLASCHYCTVDELSEKVPDLDPKTEYENRKKHEEGKAAAQKEAEAAALDVYLRRVMEGVPYLSGAAIVDGDKNGGTSYPRYELYVTVSPAEYRKRRLDFDKVADDVEKVLEDINGKEMKKFLDMDKEPYYFDTRRFVIEYSLLGWNVYENQRRNGLGVRGYLMLRYDRLFEIADKVAFRKRKDGKYLEVRY